MDPDARMTIIFSTSLGHACLIHILTVPSSPASRSRPRHESPLSRVSNQSVQAVHLRVFSTTLLPVVLVEQIPFQVTKSFQVLQYDPICSETPAQPAARRRARVPVSVLIAS